VLIRAARVVTPSGLIDGGAVRVEGGRIAAVARGAEFPDAPAPDLAGDVLMPGFIDLHWHGFGGHALGATDQAREAVRLVAQSGVTTCYAGLGAGASLGAIAETVAAAAVATGDGARLAGVFLEGPFISVARKGAWSAAELRSPSVADLRHLVAASGERVRRVNVAPELPGALECIRAARDLGIAVSLGHSDATYEQALAGVGAGATISNHTYNAMSGLDHRAPGLVGATFTSDALLAELILDGVHVLPAAARALFRARGAAGIALVTDGSPLTGVPEGRYDWLGRSVRVEDGACRLADGTLAGSVSPFDRDLRNAARWLTDDLTELAAMSSGNAARAMGIDDRTGAIAPGKDADLVLLDQDLRVLATIVAGRVVYRRE
jgi:N-acetylglucosamine-6-phosphate deacetylase